MRAGPRWALLPILLLSACAPTPTETTSAPTLPRAIATVAQPAGSSASPELRPTTAATAANSPTAATVAPSPTAGPVPRVAAPTTTVPASSRVRGPAAPAPSASPAAAARPANELGLIPVFLYHHIGEPEERWQRTPENLRQDLELLYREGYRPIHLRDIVDRTIDLPAGLSPVVLTFDDSAASQFKVLGVENGKPVIDPNSAIGILEQFAREHPDFGTTATFFIPPLADPPNRLFNQPEYNELKLKFLVERGYEIGNHTFFHQRLDQVEGQWVERQIALGKGVTESYIPGYTIDILALPLGMWPADKRLAVAGEWGDDHNPVVRYQNRAIVLAEGPPSASPYDKDFDPLAIPRIQALGYLIEDTLKSLDESPKSPPYVSDGDPNTVTIAKDYANWLNPAAVGSARVIER